MKVDLNTLSPEGLGNSQSGRAAQSGSTGVPTTASSAAGVAAGAALGASLASSPGHSVGSVAGDQVNFSFDQVRVQSLAAQVLAEPEVRAAKVQSLQQAISSDQYSVSAGQLADALSRELGGLYAQA